jgi:hypothetical protein
MLDDVTDTPGRWEHHMVRKVVRTVGKPHGLYDLYFMSGGGCTIPFYEGAAPREGERIALYLINRTIVARCVIGEREVPTLYAQRIAEEGGHHDE